MNEAVGWTRVAAAACITPFAAELYGVVFRSDNIGGGSFKLYDGRDEGGRLIFQPWINERTTLPISLTHPLRCDNGIYVGSLDHIPEILVMWNPTPRGGE